MEPSSTRIVPPLEASGHKREEFNRPQVLGVLVVRIAHEVAILKKQRGKRAARGDLVREECSFCLPDGTRRYAHRTLSPVVDDAGKASHDSGHGPRYNRATGNCAKNWRLGLNSVLRNSRRKIKHFCSKPRPYAIFLADYYAPRMRNGAALPANCMTAPGRRSLPCR